LPSFSIFLRKQNYITLKTWATRLEKGAVFTD
jgi:hypothetical protein